MNTRHISDEQLIRELYEKWNSAVETGNRSEYLDVLDEHIRMVPPGAMDIVGRDAYAAFLVPVFENAEYEITHLGEPEIEIAGDIALVRYDYIVNVNVKAGVDKITDSPAALSKQSNNAKYFDVLRRQPNGGWKVWRHMWNEGYAR